MRVSLSAPLLFVLVFGISSFAEAATVETGTVTSVVDGDTVKVKLSTNKTETLRFIGVDTPELKGTEQQKCFGKQATARTKALLLKKTVTLESNPDEDRDHFGRLLRYVSVGSKDIGAKLIENGYAFSYKKFPHPRLDSYNQLEQRAIASKKGLWKTCAAESQSSKAVHQISSQQSSQNSSQCRIKGNVSTSGEKIYHLSNCGSYAKTEITTATGERWFCTEQEAKAAGWRRAGNCK